MNEICGACRRPTREDDTLLTYHFTAIGVVQACRDCGAEFAESDPVTPIYPVGTRLPEVGDGLQRRKIRVCGICRRALRWDDESDCLRLSEEDVWQLGPDGVMERVIQEGAYSACWECVAAWRPVILARLIRHGILKPDVTVETMPQDALM